jgi:hypothetical protein
MRVPKKEQGYSVLIDEFATGHIYNTDLTLFLKGENEHEAFYISKTKEFVLNLINTNPKFECVIFDFMGKHLTTYDKHGERK